MKDSVHVSVGLSGTNSPSGDEALVIKFCDESGEFSNFDFFFSFFVSQRSKIFYHRGLFSIFGARTNAELLMLPWFVVVVEIVDGGSRNVLCMCSPHFWTSSSSMSAMRGVASIFAFDAPHRNGRMEFRRAFAGEMDVLFLFAM